LRELAEKAPGTFQHSMQVANLAEACVVTLEDVIEEIVGDINDEFDNEDLSYSKIDANNYIFDGKITIKDFCKVLEDNDEEKFEELKGESETIAGFILEISGKFPKTGDKIKFDIYTFTIEALDRKRIKQLKVTRQQNA
jgi:CBS domain containing-hemolysin-like protein